MKRRNVLTSLGLLLAAKLRGQAANGRPCYPVTSTSVACDQESTVRVGPTITARVAQHIQAGASYTIYTVSNVQAFLAMTLPLGHQVLWGGAVLLPGIQYDASATGINLRNLPLNVGDTIGIVTFSTTGK